MDLLGEARSLLKEVDRKLQSAIDEDPVIVDGYPGSTIDGASNGKRYVTITSSGIQPEGEMVSGIFFTSKSALWSARLHLNEYLRGKKRIWWRDEMKVSEDREHYLRDVSFDSPVDGFKFEKIVVYKATCRVYAE